MDELLYLSRYIRWTLALLLPLWFLGFFLFSSHIPEKISEEKTDGIVVFTGAPQRVSTALSLFQEGQGRFLLVSGVDKGQSLKGLLAYQKFSNIGRQEAISLDYISTTTQENAQQTVKWARKKKIKSLLLVTSDYHLPRAILELRYLFPEGKIIPYPVAGRKSFFLVLNEYNKYLFSWIRLAVI